MDTKSRNIKYRLGTKIVAIIVMWVSLIGSLGSGIFLLSNTDVIRTDSYEQTYEYRAGMSRLIHNTVEFGTRFKHGRNKGLEPKRYKIIEQNLSRAVNFNYYIEDLQTGEVSYKMPEGSVLAGQPDSIYISKDEISYDWFDYNDIEKMLIESPQELYVALNDPLVPGDMFYDTFTSYTMAKTLISYATVALIGGLILLIISFGYLIFASGRKEKGGEIFLTGIDRIYNDVQSLFVFIAAIISMVIVWDIGFPYGAYRAYMPEIIIVLIIFAIDVAIGMTYFFSMLRQFKKGVLLKNTIIYKSIKSGISLIHMCFNEKVFKPWILGLVLLYGLINGVLFILAIDQELIVYPLFIIPFNAIAIYYIFKNLKSLSMVMDAAKEISGGNLDYEIDQSQITMEFSGLARNIQSIQGGLKNAVNEAIKGERMKTDLITNVSHDLKTPLTSIINYVDLLKQEEIHNEKAIGYLNILDEKSGRLKQLIEDLIEASKASSGNLTITTEQVDLHELITQACGEYEEKIEKANLDIRISTPEEKIVVLADGKYMWRIVENIMSNILKYSMAGSRVYISIEESNGYGLLTMKNMSAYPLDIDPNQLTERFIRADESRTTEGSGLGLSIAQSLTSIQGGKFNIEIDGDLFKVMVAMPMGIIS